LIDNVLEALMTQENGLEASFNASKYFIDRHIDEGNLDKLAYIDDYGTYTYGKLVDATNRMADSLVTLGIKREARVAMIMQDTFNFPVVFWGCMKAGVIPVPLNTLLTSDHYEYILNDCRAETLVVEEDLYEKLYPVISNLVHLKKVVISGAKTQGDQALQVLLDNASNEFSFVETSRDEVAFWLYSSGSTGNPKGVKHRHASLYWTARLYGLNILGIRKEDVVFSAAKLFFAYGLGNGMTFPLAVGATTILNSQRVTPTVIMDILKKHQPTIFYGVPTLFAAMLADNSNNRDKGSRQLRRCASAGEALPEHIGNLWEERFDAPILDGVGSTEMLHIYLSNQPGNLRYGTSGIPVPGYLVRLVDESGLDVKEGEIGELLVAGSSASEGYWNNREKSLKTFVGCWTHTGDKYFYDNDGFYHYCGRSDDMFKSGGNWVSPFEVESVLISHAMVLEACVVPHEDDAGNTKPRAFVVLKEGMIGNQELSEELKLLVKTSIELWKYPRWIEFIDSLPKTATGKIQRYKLRKYAY